MRYELYRELGMSYRFPAAVLLQENIAVLSVLNCL